jgi:hypothetical protein
MKNKNKMRKLGKIAPLLAMAGMFGNMPPIETISSRTPIDKQNGHSSWMHNLTPKQRKARAATKRQKKARSIMRRAA